MRPDGQIARAPRCRSRVLQSRIDNDTIAAFVVGLRMKLTEPDNPAPRKNYVQAFVSEVVTAKERITVRGLVVSLVQALCSPDANCLPVRTSMEKWRTRQDSNLWPLPSEPVQNGYARLRNPTLNYCFV